MISQVVDFFRGICGQKHEQHARQRRIRKHSDAALRHCQFCNASVTCTKKVCKNCFMPFGGGLAGEKWITQEFGRRIDYLETVDAVKYRKSGMAFSAAS